MGGGRGSVALWGERGGSTKMSSCITEGQTSDQGREGRVGDWKAAEPEPEGLLSKSPIECSRAVERWIYGGEETLAFFPFSLLL